MTKKHLKKKKIVLHDLVRRRKSFEERRINSYQNKKFILLNILRAFQTFLEYIFSLEDVFIITNSILI